MVLNSRSSHQQFSRKWTRNCPQSKNTSLLNFWHMGAHTVLREVFAVTKKTKITSLCPVSFSRPITELSRWISVTTSSLIRQESTWGRCWVSLPWREEPAKERDMGYPRREEPAKERDVGYDSLSELQLRFLIVIERSDYKKWCKPHPKYTLNGADTWMWEVNFKMITRT